MKSTQKETKTTTYRDLLASLSYWSIMMNIITSNWPPSRHNPTLSPPPIGLLTLSSLKMLTKPRLFLSPKKVIVILCKAPQKVTKKQPITRKSSINIANLCSQTRPPPLVWKPTPGSLKITKNLLINFINRDLRPENRTISKKRYNITQKLYSCTHNTSKLSSTADSLTIR